MGVVDLESPVKIALSETVAALTAFAVPMPNTAALVVSWLSEAVPNSPIPPAAPSQLFLIPPHPVWLSVTTVTAASLSTPRAKAVHSETAALNGDFADQLIHTVVMDVKENSALVLEPLYVLLRSRDCGAVSTFLDLSLPVFLWHEIMTDGSFRSNYACISHALEFGFGLMKNLLWHEVVSGEL